MAGITELLSQGKELHHQLVDVFTSKLGWQETLDVVLDLFMLFDRDTVDVLDEMQACHGKRVIFIASQLQVFQEIRMQRVEEADDSFSIVGFVQFIALS